ncbi:MAG: aspartate carbamoyltransferase [Dehalococcoidales bacterium]|nr:aspartate carbamoyltransferase [Dehalococcoidales bacterium]
MSLANRSLVTIDDLSNGEIESLFSLADDMSGAMDKQLDLCRGKIMASLFFEPSTRTRLSFETAMHKLGGSVISVVDVKATSLAKGESIADMARVVGSYADIIVVRHPWEGAAKVIADYAGVPVINAGDGGHEHPTQTLCDLYTLKKERQTLKGLRIALWGDLKHGRTIHSLTYALARFGAIIHFRSGPGLELPEYVKRKLETEYTGRLERYENLSSLLKGRHFPINAIYMTPSSPHQLANIPDVSMQVELEKGVEALYVTRLQMERLSTKAGGGLKEDYPIVDKELLEGKEFSETLVLHPLPRVDELSRELDADPRSMYFKQASLGVPVRMALVALLLGARKAPIIKEDDSFIQKIEHPPCKYIYGVICPNHNCVSRHETKYIKPEFILVCRQPIILRCVYCEHEVNPPYIASSEWHEGVLIHKQYHSSDSHWARKIRAENLIIFNSEKEAESHGFKPSHYAKKHYRITKKKVEQ